MRYRQSLPRRGMTLIELLMVIGILVMLVAVAAPAVRPQLKDRKLREASRQLNTFISGAKARAAEANRPMGIWIKRDTTPGRELGAFQIFMAETPVPFSGETIGAMATLRDGGGGYANSATFADSQSLGAEATAIRFNNRGPWYPVASGSAGSVTLATVIHPKTGLPVTSSLLPLPKVPVGGTLDVPFQLLRKPRRASGAPLELTSGMAIDLEWSGLGATGQEMQTPNSATGEIVVMFNPTGSVESVRGFNFNMPGTIHFLVGRVDQLSSLAEDATKRNIVDPTVSWVSIGHLTGTVTTAENYVLDPASMASATAASQIGTARTIAVTKQTMGGR